MTEVLGTRWDRLLIDEHVENEILGDSVPDDAVDAAPADHDAELILDALEAVYVAWRKPEWMPGQDLDEAIDDALCVLNNYGRHPEEES